MSGIAGIFERTQRRVDVAMLHNMIVSIRHRGPDAVGHQVEGCVGLGHCILHTTAESRQEPLPWAQEGVTITADARIDNREALLSALKLHDKSIPDSQLILHAYLQWGTACPERLLGDFSFVIFDGPQNRLFCARDPIGVKPFFYYLGPDLFAFASEIGALLRLPDVPRRLNESRIADLLVSVFIEQQGTCFRDIVRLEPGHWLMVGSEKSEKKCYWEFDAEREEHLGSDEAYAEGFRHHFMEAVRCRVRSAFPVGSTLSGGLDSSSVACTASRFLSDAKLHTFSAVFPNVVKIDPRIDEREYMDAVLASGAFEPHFVRADEARPLADVLWYEDEMLAAPSMYMGRAIFQEARSSGVRVLLSGFDGDSVVSHGLERLYELAAAGNWTEFQEMSMALINIRSEGAFKGYLRVYGMPHLVTLATNNRWGAFARSVKQIHNRFGVPSRQMYLRYGLKTLLSDSADRMLKSRRQAVVKNFNPLIQPGFAKRVGLADRLETYVGMGQGHKYTLREQLKGSFINGNFEFVTGVFDRATARYSIEQRYPFFDRRLMEFCLALPFEQKLKNGWTRSVFRRAMEGILPPEVQWRTSKANLEANLCLLLARERDILDSVIVNNPDVIERFVDIDLLRASYERFLENPVGASQTEVLSIFLSVHLGGWLLNSGRELGLI